MPRNNIPPPYAEELVINQETINIREILTKFKQPIPASFIQLETRGRNYMCSTRSWKEPVCERYGFFVENKWVQLDIPHTLMEKLELEIGQEISYPIYISKRVLEKELTFGGITLEKEQEIFLERPLTEKSCGQELVRRLEELEGLREKEEMSRQKINDLEAKLVEVEKTKEENEILKNEKSKLLSFLDIYRLNKWFYFLEGTIDSSIWVSFIEQHIAGIDLFKLGYRVKTLNGDTLDMRNLPINSSTLEAFFVERYKKGDEYQSEVKFLLPKVIWDRKTSLTNRLISTSAHLSAMGGFSFTTNFDYKKEGNHIIYEVKGERETQG